MRIFNKIRIAYFDELAEDPDVAKVINSSDISNRFIRDLDTGGGRSGLWIPEAISKISQIKLESSRNSEYIASSNSSGIKWARVYRSSGKTPIRVDYMGVNSGLTPERGAGRIALWDTKTKQMLFISSNIVDSFSDQNYKQNFLEKLSIALDSNSEKLEL